MLINNKTLKALPSSSWSIISGGEDEKPLKIETKPNKEISATYRFEPTENIKIEPYVEYNLATGETTGGLRGTYSWW